LLLACDPGQTFHKAFLHDEATNGQNRSCDTNPTRRILARLFLPIPKTSSSEYLYEVIQHRRKLPIMAENFIGLHMVVTLKDPPNMQLKGTISGIDFDASLGQYHKMTLSNGLFLFLVTSGANG
jgi:hypothetical protein